MAVHTSVGFLVVGSGLLAYVINAGRGRDAATTRWVATTSVALCMTGMAVGLWGALESEDDSLVRTAVTSDLVRISILLASHAPVAW